MYPIGARPSVALATGGILMFAVSILITGCGGSEGQTPPPELEAPAVHIVRTVQTACTQLAPRGGRMPYIHVP